ncbi:MAG: ABC transporter substrate-binding protein [Bradymonadales bacterium]|nr:MAG: ABC transporter substrate-binding protein [Bradymonadales bacterium]
MIDWFRFQSFGMRSPLFLLLCALSFCSLSSSMIQASATDGGNLKVFVDLQGGEFFPTEGPWNPRAYPRVTVYNAVLGHLVNMTAEGKVVPALLQSWSRNESSKRFSLKLQSNLVFHDGRPVEAEDLRFSLMRHLNSSEETPERANIEDIEEVRILNELEVEVVLKNPNPFFVGRLSMSGLSLVPREHLLEDGLRWKSYPVGAGPYRVVKLDERNLILASTGSFPSAHPDRPKRIHLTSDLSTTDAELVLGSNDLSHGEDLSLEVLNVPARIYAIAFNFRSSLGSSQDFREAVSLVLNRAALAERSSHSRPSTWLIPERLVARDLAPEERMDGARAKQIFEKLGIKSLDIPIYVKDPHPWMVELQGQFEASGVELRFRQANMRLFDPADERSPFWLIGWMPNVADALVIFEIFKDGGPYVANSGLEDAEYLRLLERARSEADPERREQAVRRLAEHFNGVHRVIPLFEEQVAYPRCTRVVRQISDPLQEQSILFHRIQINSAR